ncbi:hypothetical protein [Cetobacterium sp.]|uniref:hypothetical protein n=1 Tax=Cetobacterium sp. TaxID=2071632 RepID=UPI003F3582BA
MRSFALWYERRDQNDQSEAELDIHINLWKSKKMNKYSFDYGLKIKNIEKIKKIYMYVPFKINEITDLGKILKENTNLVSAIFNEKCSVDASYPSRMKVRNESGEECIIYSLNHKDYQIIDIKDKGSVIVFSLGDILNENEKKSLKNIENIKTYYFRFRFSALAQNISMIKDQESEKSIFSNMFKKVEIIDFRINDERSWGEEIKQDYMRGNPFKIIRIHYLMLRDANDEFIYYDGAIKSRILEKEVWSNYIEDLERDIMTYHIKKSGEEIRIKEKNTETGEEEEVKKIEGIKSFVCLSRFKYVEESTNLLLLYGIIAISLSILGNIMYLLLTSPIEVFFGKILDEKVYPLRIYSNLVLIIIIIMMLFKLLKRDKCLKKK